MRPLESFRGRLSLFFVIIVIVPMLAAALMLFSITADSERGKSDARIASGLRTARALYDEGRRDARAALAQVSGDPALNRALVGERTAQIDRRAEALAREIPDVRSILVLDRRGRELGRAGSRRSIAPASAAPVGPGGRRLGTLSVSTTDAARFAREVRRLTGLEVVVFQEGAELAATAEGAAGAQSGELELGGEEHRGRFQTVRQAAGPSLQIGVFEPAKLTADRISKSRKLIGLIMLIFLVFALAASRWPAGALQGQLEEFLQAARRLGRGDFSQKVPTVGEDEFAALGDEFNKMSEQLEAKIEEVEQRRRELEETIRRVGAAFAAGLDRGSSAELAVQTVMEACSADAGRIVPLDRGKMEAVRQGAVDERFERALVGVERKTFTVRPEDREELQGYLEGAAQEGAENRIVAHEVGGVHSLAFPLRARLTASSDIHYAGVLSIAREGAPFSEEEQDLFGYLGAQAGISIENIDLHETVQRQAVTDELTGLFNVRHFHETLGREIDRSARFQTDIGLVMMDVDDFKKVNDTYGHQQGDLVLVEVARVLRTLARAIDEPARYGGEEMAVVLPQSGMEGAAAQAERFRQAIESLAIPRLDGEGALKITASFGVASLPGGSVEKDGLIAAADAALYRAKHAGKNRVERAEPARAGR